MSLSAACARAHRHLPAQQPRHHSIPESGFFTSCATLPPFRRRRPGDRADAHVLECSTRVRSLKNIARRRPRSRRCTTRACSHHLARRRSRSSTRSAGVQVEHGAEDPHDFVLVAKHLCERSSEIDSAAGHAEDPVRLGVHQRERPYTRDRETPYACPTRWCRKNSRQSRHRHRQATRVLCRRKRGTREPSGRRPERDSAALFRHRNRPSWTADGVTNAVEVANGVPFPPTRQVAAHQYVGERPPPCLSAE